jgi:hypothetical protein
MADLKRRTLTLSTGKLVKLFGNSLAIGKSLEIGEGGAPNIFSSFSGIDSGKPGISVANPYKLTAEELHEIADFQIQLWIELKNKIREFGINSPKIFNIEKQVDNNVYSKKKAADKSSTE